MEKVLVLRTCKSDMTSHDGFRWPESGRVEAPDWDPATQCGGGLHGFLWGEGDGTLACWEPNARWLVAEVDAETIVHILGKVKFPSATVVYCGDRLSATKYLMEHGGLGYAIIGSTVTTGNRGVAVSGYRGSATSGDWGSSIAGIGGTAVAGYRGMATAGDWGTAVAGYRGVATAGDRGSATAGDWGTATVGDGGKAMSGEGGTAIAGIGGAATVGINGTANVGLGGTAQAGLGGFMFICRPDDRDGKRRIVVLHAGEDGIEANITYRIDHDVPVMVKAKDKEA